MALPGTTDSLYPLAAVALGLVRYDTGAFLDRWAAPGVDSRPEQMARAGVLTNDQADDLRHRVAVLLRWANDRVESVAALLNDMLGAPTDPVTVAGHDPLAGTDPSAAAPSGDDSPAYADAADGLARFAWQGLREELVGTGGVGELIVVADRNLMDRKLVLKQLLPEYADNPRARRRLLDEADRTGSLTHQGVPRVYLKGEHVSGRPFYVMDRIDGTDLRAEINSYRRLVASGRPPDHIGRELHRLLTRFIAACRTVHHAHTVNSCLHLDLKPSNIMVSEHGETWVVDWGLSARMTAEPGADGKPVRKLDPPPLGSSGTPNYMSPEIARGTLDEIGPASDVFSLGCTLYCLLAGRPPFDGDSPEQVLELVRRVDYRPLDSHDPLIPQPVAEVCRRAMAARPADRYSSVKELADAVEEVDPTISMHIYRLLEARPREFTASLALIRRMGVLAVPMLRTERTAAREEGAAPLRRLRLTLALLYLDEANRVEYANEIAGRMLEPEPLVELVLFREALKEVAPAAIRDALGRRLVAAAADAGRPDEQFRALVALADFPADGNPWDADPAAAAATVTRLSFGLDQYHRPRRAYLRPQDWAEAFRPRREHLIDPLAVVLGRPAGSPYEWTVAGDLLVKFLRGDRHRLKQLLVEAVRDPAVSGDRFPRPLDAVRGMLLYPSWRDSEYIDPTRGSALRHPLPLSSEGLADPFAVKARAYEFVFHLDRFVRRSTGSASGADLDMGADDDIWRANLAAESDPSLRTQLIHMFEMAGIPAAALANRLGREKEPSVRRALLLALGQYPPSALDLLDRDALLRDYRDDPDPGTRSAVGWMVRALCEQQLPDAFAAADRQLRPTPDGPPSGPTGGRRWYLTRTGHEMVILPPPEAEDGVMGSTDETDPRRDGDEHRHRRHLKPFAISSRPVTIGEFREFEAQQGQPHRDREYGSESSFPVYQVNWFQAVAFCNWLSRLEGFADDDLCYRTYPDDTIPGGIGVEVVAGWRTKPAYRLPTEWEWEYATRAGASTSRHSGRTQEFLDQYAWYLTNSGNTMHPVGRLKPNEFGLFDTLGSVWEWCHEAYNPDPPPGDLAREVVFDDSPGDAERVVPTGLRVIRGGSLFLAANELRCAERRFHSPSDGRSSFGFRMARTLSESAPRAGRH
jgi:formylglycine-generating enzyme required for sulfatase activity/tRNA A-37 threonylcarbamoyl transferase component Bud32